MLPFVHYLPRVFVTALISCRPSVPARLNVVHNDLTEGGIPYNVCNVTFFVIRGLCRCWWTILIQRVHCSFKQKWLVIKIRKSLIEAVVVKFSRC